MSTRRLYFGTCQTCPHDTGRCNAVLVDPANLPPEAIQRAAAAVYETKRVIYPDSYWSGAGRERDRAVTLAEAAITAFLSDPEQGDQ